MDRIHLTSIRVATVAGLLTLSLPWSAGQGGSTQVPSAPSNLTLVASDIPGEILNPFMRTAMAGHDAASASWTDIKDNTFEQRGPFLSGLRRLQARVDLQIGELAAKRATMVARDTETGPWDFAMKEMENARAYLLSMSGVAGSATRDNWDQMKLKVGGAWERTQDAYGKVLSSTTA